MGARGLDGGSDGRHRPSAAHHDEALAAGLYGVKDLREAPRRFGGAQSLHRIRLSGWLNHQLARSRGYAVSS